MRGLIFTTFVKTVKFCPREIEKKNLDTTVIIIKQK